jgi:hypothetical protein
MERTYLRNEEEIIDYLNVDGKSQELITPEIVLFAQKIEEEYDDNYYYALACFFDKYPSIIAEEDERKAKNKYDNFEYREEWRENGIVIFTIKEEWSEEDKRIAYLEDEAWEKEVERRLEY